MSATTQAAPRVDALFTVAEARSDRWRKLVNAANAWQSSATEHLPERDRDREIVSACLSELREWEDFFAYPGVALLRKVHDRIASSEAVSATRLIHQISAALSSHSYRWSVNEWDTEDEPGPALREAVKGLGQEGTAYRPYFEVMIVSPRAAAARSEGAQELTNLRRQQDRFIYEPVVVGNFEDAVLGAILNGSIQAVVLYDSIPFASSHNSPVLRELL